MDLNSHVNKDNNYFQRFSMKHFLTYYYKKIQKLDKILKVKVSISDLRTIDCIETVLLLQEYFDADHD